MHEPIGKDRNGKASKTSSKQPVQPNPHASRAGSRSVPRGSDHSLRKRRRYGYVKPCIVNLPWGNYTVLKNDTHQSLRFGFPFDFPRPV